MVRDRTSQETRYGFGDAEGVGKFTISLLKIVRGGYDDDKKLSYIPSQDIGSKQETRRYDAFVKLADSVDRQIPKSTRDLQAAKENFWWQQLSTLNESDIDELSTLASNPRIQEVRAKPAPGKGKKDGYASVREAIQHVDQFLAYHDLAQTLQGGKSAEEVIKQEGLHRLLPKAHLAEQSVVYKRFKGSDNTQLAQEGQYSPERSKQMARFIQALRRKENEQKNEKHNTDLQEKATLHEDAFNQLINKDFLSADNPAYFTENRAPHDFAEIARRYARAMKIVDPTKAEDDERADFFSISYELQTNAATFQKNQNFQVERWKVYGHMMRVFARDSGRILQELGSDAAMVMDRFIRDSQVQSDLTHHRGDIMNASRLELIRAKIPRS